MADDDANPLEADDEANGVGEGSEEGEEYSSASSSDYDSEDSSSDDDGGGGGEGGGGGGGGGRYDSKKDEPEEGNPAEANFRAFSEILDSRSYRKKEEEEVRGIVPLEDNYDFPIDKENWCEEDLEELWADAPLKMTKPGWDPDFADDDDWDAVIDVVKDGGDLPIAPFYLPYRKHYPVIPDNHYDISSAKAVIEELDRTEEFLIWVSFIFEDGSS